MLLLLVSNVSLTGDVRAHSVYLLSRSVGLKDNNALYLTIMLPLISRLRSVTFDFMTSKLMNLVHHPDISTHLLTVIEIGLQKQWGPSSFLDATNCCTRSASHLLLHGRVYFPPRELFVLVNESLDVAKPIHLNVFVQTSSSEQRVSDLPGAALTPAHLLAVQKFNWRRVKETKTR